MRTHKRGEVLIFTEGAYSDYGILSIARVTCDEFDIVGRMSAWLEQHPEQLPKYRFQVMEFYESIIESGDLEPIEVSEISLGSYGTAEIYADDDHWGPDRPPEPPIEWQGGPGFHSTSADVCSAAWVVAAPSKGDDDE